MMKRSLYAAVAVCIAVLVTAGCGTSPDDLYSEAKSLISEREKMTEGIAMLEEFREIYPDDPRIPEVLLTLGSLYQAEREYTNAVAVYEELCNEHTGTPEEYKSWFLLGYMYYEDMKKTDKAERIFRSFVEAYPDSELAVSARVLLENIDRPIEEWAVFEDTDSTESHAEAGSSQGN